MLASPLLAVAAAAVKLDGGPVLYRQLRVGKDGVEFELLKLRTMVVGAETMGAGFAVNEGDSRITRAVFGARSMSARMAPEVDSRARNSSTWPSSTSDVITAAASK